MNRRHWLSTLLSCLVLLACGEKLSSVGGNELECGGHENCATRLSVPGGSFNRSNDAQFPATVGTFALDKYEVTVARFRAFVEAFDGWRKNGHPAVREGSHPVAGNSGWQASWPLVSSAEELKKNLHCNPKSETWTDTAGAREAWPINCVNWYEAFAFCAWSSLRLPSEAEWNYTAAGGSEQRKYPWGQEEPAHDARLAVYGCYFGTGHLCELDDLAPVGSAPAGNGRFGHAFWRVTSGSGLWMARANILPFVTTASLKPRGRIME